MQLHLKILCSCILMNNLILQRFSCLNQPFSKDIKYLWTFQPISVLDIFQELQYPYIVLFHYFSTMNGQIFVKSIACTSVFIVLYVLHGYYSNMNHFSFIISLNLGWLPSSSSSPHKTEICQGMCILRMQLFIYKERIVLGLK